MWNTLGSSMELVPMIHPLQLQLMEQWSRSMEAAFKSMLQMAEIAAEVIDDSTLMHINDLTQKLTSSTQGHSAATGFTSPGGTEERRVAVVTGGCGGIGTEICRKLASNGNQVVATYVAPEAEYAKQWQKERRAEGHDIPIVECDVTDFDSCVAMAQEI